MWNIGLVIGILYGGILSAYFLSLISFRLFAVYQQAGYSEKGFMKWFFRRGNVQKGRLASLALCLFLLLALFSVCFSFLGERWANLISVLPYAGLYLLYDRAERKYALKVKPAATARLVRLAVCDFFLWLILCWGCAFGLAALGNALGGVWRLFRFVPFALLPLVAPFVTVSAGLIMKIYEIPRNRRFVRRARETLGRSECVKVGITGSFAKTTVKFLAAHILSRKYRVIATPASYNTPAGIARTVKELGVDCDVFLAEMGARRRGDIAELCAIVRPHYGVVTGICPQHLETFGSLEEIRAEKGELASYAELTILGESAGDLPAKESRVAGRDFAAEDVVLSTEGSSFLLRLGKERFPVTLPLLGRAAAEDAALAAALCRELGMTGEEIASALASAPAVEHRLQKIVSGGVTVLDDAYNANTEGAKNAIETLGLFPGRKYVVTPGLVEMGMLEEKANEELGRQLVGCNVLLIGETLVLPVRRGFLDAGGSEQALRIFPTLDEGVRALKRELEDGDCVLFLNDLPDVMMR